MRVPFAILIVLAALAFVAFPAEAGAGGVIRAGSYTAEVGEEVTVVLQAVDIPPPGLGAWTIDMMYDTAVVTATGCEAQLGGVCSPAFMDDTVRTTGALAAGVPGSFALTMFSFRCDVAGTSELILTEEVLTTAEPVQEGTILLENGSITCTEPGQDGVIRIGSYEGVVGDEVSVVLEAVDIPPPGLGAWDVDVTYDTAILSLVGCAPRQGGICDLERKEDTVRVAGANAAGLPGTFALAEIVFTCLVPGTTDLDVILNFGFAFVVDDPPSIPDPFSGTLTCAEPPDLITISSLDLLVGQQRTVLVEAERVAQPGVGAWTLDISYDASVVSFLGCEVLDELSDCSEEVLGTVRVRGASAEGLQPGTVLAELEFRCDQPGATDLRTEVKNWSVAGIGFMDRLVDVEEGRVLCGTQLPSTGGAEPQRASPPATVPIAVAGAVLVAAAFAFRRYASPR